MANMMVVSFASWFTWKARNAPFTTNEKYLQVRPSRKRKSFFSTSLFSNSDKKNSISWCEVEICRDRFERMESNEFTRSKYNIHLLFVPQILNRICHRGLNGLETGGQKSNQYDRNSRHC